MARQKCHTVKGLRVEIFSVLRLRQKKYYPALDGMASRSGRTAGKVRASVRSPQGAKTLVFSLYRSLLLGAKQGGYYDTPLGVHCPLSRDLILLLTNSNITVTVLI